MNYSYDFSCYTYKYQWQILPPTLQFTARRDVSCRMLSNETGTFSDIYNLSAEDYEDVQLDSFPFSVRTNRRFSESGLITIADLLKTRPETLMNIKGFGKTSLEEVEKFCAEHPFTRTIETDKIMKSMLLPTSFRDIMKRYVDQVVFGDFSFAEQLALSSEEYACLQQYKDAFFALGDELAFDCVSVPERMSPINAICSADSQI